MMLFAGVSAQTVSLTFTGSDVLDQYVPLTQVVVTNHTKGWQETLVWPDTVLVLTPTGIADFESQNRSLGLSLNNSNPFDGTTYALLHISEPGDVTVEITDIAGRKIKTLQATSVPSGTHEMRVSLSAAGIYFLTARQNGKTASMKMVNRGNGGSNNIVFSGVETQNFASLRQSQNTGRGVSNSPFDLGDLMEYVGYATYHGNLVESAHITQEVFSSQTNVLPFSFSISGDDAEPCPGLPTVMDYDSNLYNTVQIGTQCWLRENLRATHYPDGTAIPNGGDTMSNTAPFYYDNTTSTIPLDKRGYWYNWQAAMQACPEGWHLPSDSEWTVLHDYLGLQSDYICHEDPNQIAKALAHDLYWVTAYEECSPGDLSVYANNATGFGAVPTGESYGSDSEGIYVMFWSSTTNYTTFAWVRLLGNSCPTLLRDYSVKLSGHSVRCLRNEE